MLSCSNNVFFTERHNNAFASIRSKNTAKVIVRGKG